MPTAAPADDIILCQPTGEKKRKEVDAAANNQSGPPKKKQYRYECSAEGCTKYAVKGGVCIKHGAKVKVYRCSVEGCTKYAQRRGVCIRHGAKVKVYRCSREGCTNQAQRRGVCIRHGAKVKIVYTPKASGFGGYCGDQQTQQQQQTSTGAAFASYSLNFPPYPQQQWNNSYCHNNPFVNSNWTPPCIIEGCNATASYGGYCWMHGSQLAAPLAQVNIQRGYIEEGDNQNNAPAVEIISDDEEAGGKKLPPIAHRKREEVSATQQMTGTSRATQGGGNESDLKIAENIDAIPERDDANCSAVRGEGNPKDDEEPDTSDLALGQEKMGRSEMAADGDDDWGGSEYNDYDAEDDNDEVELESRADAVGGVAANVEKESTQMAVAKLMELDSSVEAIVARDDLNLRVEAPPKISKGLTNQIETLSAEITPLKARLEVATRNVANLRREKEQLNARLKTSAVELKEMTTKIDALNATLAKVTENEALLNAQLQRESDDFAAERASFQSKVEELTAKLEEASRNEAAMNDRLQTLTDGFAAERACLESNNDERQKEVEELTAKLEEATRNEAAINDRLQKANNDFAAKRACLESNNDQRQREVEELTAKLEEATRNESAINGRLQTLTDGFAAERACLESNNDQRQKEVKELTAKLEEATRNESAMNDRLQTLTDGFAAERACLESNNDERQKEVEELTAKLEEATRNEATKNAEQQSMTNEFAAKQSSLKLALEKKQSKIDELCATLDERLTEVTGKSERIRTLSLELRRREEELEEKSTEAAALNVRLAELAENVDMTRRQADLEREIGMLKEAHIELKEALHMKEDKDFDATNSPKRRSRRSPRCPKKSSLEALADQSKKSNFGRNKTFDEEDPHAECNDDEKLVQMIMNEIVDNGEEVKFDDVAGINDVKDAIRRMAINPLKRPELFVGLRAFPKALLLFGPPGTGKTLIGKAIAHESDATFFSISSSSIASKWHGESEKLVKTLFTLASFHEPSVVFIDEVDSLLSQRKSNEDESSRKIKTEFLVQLDGVGNKTNERVLVIGATNLPQELDDAARRRFKKRFYVPLPDRHGREALLRNALSKNSHTLTDENFEKLSRDTEGYSGADMKTLCEDAAHVPIQSEDIMRIDANSLPPISYEHFCQALSCMNPSVAQDDLQVYDDWNTVYGNKAQASTLCL